MKLTSDNVKTVYMLAAGAIVVYMAYKAKQGAEVVAATAKKVVEEDLNPVSSQNVVYRNVPLSVKDKIMDFYEFIGL